MVNEIILQSNDLAQFGQLADMTLMTVADSTQRNYARNYRQWLAYCADRNLSPFDLQPKYVSDFVNSMPITKAARGRVLAAIRKLAQVLAIANPDFMQQYETLKLVRPSDRQTDNSRKQTKRALSPADVEQVLNAFPADSKRNIRNRALLAVLFYTGVRRSEAAVLTWEDIDWHNGTINIASGKGDKQRIVAVVGEDCLERLQLWRTYHEPERQYIFCEVHWSDHLQADAPISGSAVYNIVKEAEVLTGVVFKPHDARRTLITESLNNGAPVHEVQAQAGHSSASTTLDNYAKATDAQKRRNVLKTRY